MSLNKIFAERIKNEDWKLYKKHSIFYCVF